MGISERKKREKEQRRSAIIDAAEQVFFSKGIEDATMDEVAEKAEFSKGTLYLYFKNKNELLHAIIGRGLETLLTMFKTAAGKEKKGIEKIKAIGRAYYEFYQKEPDYFMAMLHQDSLEIDSQMLEDNPNFARSIEIGNKIFALMQETIATGIADATIRQDLDPNKLSLVLWGHTTGVLNIVKAKGAVIKNLFQFNPEEIIEYSFQLIRDYLENKSSEN